MLLLRSLKLRLQHHSLRRNAMNRRDLILLPALALLVTLLNACKPPVIDDSTYLYYAAEFHEHPQRPYDFDYYGKEANNNLVPPILPAWLALGIALVGNQTFALKLWMFPVLLLLVCSLTALLRRFAPRVEVPLVILTVLSPALLPSINFMLDVPVIALGMTALAVYLRAFDRQSFGMAILAGAIAGLAMETKYSAFTLPIVFLAHAYLYRRWRPALAASATAVGFFVGSECLIALIHGDSHFLLGLHWRGQQQKTLLATHLIVAAVALPGGLASILWLVGLTALGVSRRIVLTLLALILICFALLIAVPIEYAVLIRSGDGQSLLSLNNLVFVPPGVALLVTLFVASRRLLGTGDEDVAADRFVVAWLLIEAAGYLAISPFPAVRRLFGMLVAGTILVGRLASREHSDPARSATLRILAAAGALLGLGFYSIELVDAQTERDAFHQAVTNIQNRDRDACIRWSGTWGFVYHAEQANLKWSKNAGEDLQPGDWFIHDLRDGMPLHPSVASYLVPVERIAPRNAFPLSTQGSFYYGRTPIAHVDRPIIEMIIYRYPSSAE